MYIDTKTNNLNNCLEDKSISNKTIRGKGLGVLNYETIVEI
jgi:hypothetical protein